MYAINKLSFIPGPHDFIGRYTGRVSVEQLMRRNISLYCLSIHHDIACFVEFKGGDNPFNCRKYPLLFVAQKEFSLHVYIMPLPLFLQFTNRLDEQSRRVVWMFHSARCGSTVWSQVFNALPGWGVISESVYMSNIIIHETGTGDVLSVTSTKQFKALALSGLKFNLSRFPSGHSIFIKAGNHDTHLLEAVSEYLNDLTIMHCYRNALPSAESWYYTLSKLAEISPLLYLLERAKQDGWHESRVLKEIVHIYTQSWPESIDILQQVGPEGLFEWFLVIWCTFNCRIRAAKESGTKIACIKYEDMQHDNEGVIKKLFNHLEIDPTLFEVATEATRSDSQSNTFLSRDKRIGNRCWVRTTESDKRSNTILAKMGFPNLDGDFLLEDTL